MIDDARSNKDDRQLGHKNARHAGNSSQNNGNREDGKVLNIVALDIYYVLHN